jgi:lysozyme
MLTGIDVSRWQGVIDWALVKPQVSFAILKATEGVYWTDPTYLVNKQGCAANGIPHGAYHFFRSNADPIAQANHFYDVAGSDIDVLVCDVETNDGGDLKANLRAFMDRLDELTNSYNWIYTGPAFWKAYGIHDPEWCDQYHLWIANYGVNIPAIPPGWSYWLLWQYSYKGVIKGIPGNSVDMNYYDGTYADIRLLFGNGEPVPPVPLPDRVRVTASVLNVRAKPMGLILGQVKKGWLLGVDGEQMYNGVRWYRIGTGYVSSEWTETIE